MLTPLLISRSSCGSEPSTETQEYAPHTGSSWTPRHPGSPFQRTGCRGTHVPRARKATPGHGATSHVVTGPSITPLEVTNCLHAFLCCMRSAKFAEPESPSSHARRSGHSDTFRGSVRPVSGRLGHAELTSGRRDYGVRFERSFSVPNMPQRPVFLMRSPFAGSPRMPAMEPSSTQLECVPEELASRRRGVGTGCWRCG